MPGSNCAIVGCPACKSKNRGLSFFHLPKDNTEWRNKLLGIIKSSRSDKINPQNLTICSRHFKYECFIEHVSSKTGLTRRLLKPWSLPTLFLPVKSVPSTKLPPRKAPAERSLVKINADKPHIDEKVSTFQQFSTSVKETTGNLPAGWTYSISSNSINLIKIENGQIQMHIIIDSDLKCVIRHHNFLLPTTLNVTTTCLELIECLDTLKICTGITDVALQSYSDIRSTDNHFLHAFLSMKKQNDFQYQTCVRSKNCSGILQEVETMCVNCRQINRNLKRRLDRSQNKKKVIGTKTPLQHVSKSVYAKAVKTYSSP